jgi:hypothetical protein
MKSETGTPWQEIIAPAPPSPPLWPTVAWGGTSLVLLLLLAWLFRTWWRRPRQLARRRLERIRRQVVSGRLSPREGLHAAAACLAAGPMDEADDRLLSRRFARHAPEAPMVDELLQRLHQGMGR